MFERLNVGMLVCLDVVTFERLDVWMLGRMDALSGHSTMVVTIIATLSPLTKCLAERQMIYTSKVSRTNTGEIFTYLTPFTFS